MQSSILIVETDRKFGEHLLFLARKTVGLGVLAHTTFEAARKHIAMRPPTMLVTNVMLGSVSGVQLAHATRLASSTSRALIYGDPTDLVFASLTQRSRVFYERRDFIPHSLTRYLTSELPAGDRRGIRSIDRRGTFRGGRRATDSESVRAGRLRVWRP